MTGFWIFKELQAKNALIAVPSLFLIKQTLKEWAKESTARNETFDWIVICSDEKSNDFSDEPSMRKIDLGIKVETDKEKIGEFLNNQKCVIYNLRIDPIKTGDIIYNNCVRKFSESRINY